MEQIIKIGVFIIDSFIHIWPYLIISIPLAVAVQLSGAAKYINKIFKRNTIVAILLATIVGAFSPFCSCGVIPIIAFLLISGVPLAPVMSFWIASPSMDPEIFFLSTATIGWELSVWRLVATFVISLSSGYITHFAIQKGFLEKDVLRENQASAIKNPWKFVGLKIINELKNIVGLFKPQKNVEVQLIGITGLSKQSNVNCCVSGEELIFQPKLTAEKSCGCNETTNDNSELRSSSCKETSCSSSKQNSVNSHPTLGRRLVTESWKATIMIVKFMALAFFINALINFYVPKGFISNLLGGDGSFSVIIASMVGIPAYTSNLTALPLVGGLLTLGMNKGAALAFLIAGPTTTLPAMVAVWGIAKKKIFFLYISFSLVGAILFGLLYNLIN